MSETVESYKIALEQEISRWNGFARALRKDDREAFEKLMDAFRSHASECNNATQPVVFETDGNIHHTCSARKNEANRKGARCDPTRHKQSSSGKRNPSKSRTNSSSF